jgi:hypothetical protein
MRKALAAITVLFVAMPAAGFDLTGRGEDLPDVYRSAAGLGRGDTGIAAAEHEEALFYNPAGLALSEPAPRVVLVSPMLEASKAARDAYLRASIPDADPIDVAQSVIGKNLHVGAANFSGFVARRMGLGLFSAASADAMVFKNPAIGGIESAVARADAHAGAMAGGGRGFAGDKLLVGGALKALRRGRAYAAADPFMTEEELEAQVREGENAGYGFGVGADLGLMLRSSPTRARGQSARWLAGAVVRDVGTTRIRPESEPAPPLDLRQTVNVGLAVELAQPGLFLRLSGDYRDVTAAYPDVPVYQRAGLGAELWLKPTAGLRAGLHDGYACGGAFVDFVVLRVDAAVYTEEMGKSPGARPDTRYVGRLSLGI